MIGSSDSGKTRFWLTPQLLQAHSSYVVVDPKGGTLSQVGYFLQRKKGYKFKVFNSIDFSKSMHYNLLAYVRNEADILKFVDTLISNTKGEGKESDPYQSLILGTFKIFATLFIQKQIFLWDRQFPHSRKLSVRPHSDPGCSPEHSHNDFPCHTPP